MWLLYNDRTFQKFKKPIKSFEKVSILSTLPCSVFTFSNLHTIVQIRVSTELNMPLSMRNNNPLSLSSNGKRKSAFSPYKPTATVLTNLQRGNTEASVQVEISLNFHERAGQGEITELQTRQLQYIDETDKNHLTPLHWACHYGQLSSVKILLKCGANASKLAPDHVSPLLLAAAGGHHEIVRLLLQHGADPNHTDIVSIPFRKKKDF